MVSGIRATVEFDSPDLCPVVEASAAAGTSVQSVSTGCASDCATCVTEFSVSADCEDDVDLDPIFSTGSTLRYRVTREEMDCPCARLADLGCPVERYDARDGALTLVFHAVDYEELRTVVAALRERFPDVNIKRFVRSPGGEHAVDNVLVDMQKLTARQREVLETAFEMGYFERPRRANATAVAEELDISPSTFGEHLSAAEQKLFADLL